MINDPTPAYAYIPPTEFTVGTVLSRATDVFTRGALTFVAISLIANAPRLVYEWALLNGTSPATPWMPLAWGLVSVVLSALAEAMIIFAAFQTLRGRRAGIGESIGRGLRRLGAVVLASIVVSILIVLGAILLLVPGLIVLTIFFVTIPACVVEQLGATTAMARSSELTRNHRWRVFGAAAVVFIIFFIVDSIVSAVLRHPATLWSYVLVAFCVNSVYSAYNAVLAAIVYHDLRVIKDGIDIDQLAAVFD